MQILWQMKQAFVNDILEKIPLAQPTISQHLKVLKDANLIKGTIEGNTVCYCINESTFELLSKYFGNIASNVIHQDCC